MKVFTAYWLETAELPPGPRPRPSPMALPFDPLRVLAVAADDAHHAPIRALLKGAQIDHVVTGDEAHHAVAANRYDAAGRAAAWRRRSRRPAASRGRSGR